MFFVIYKIKIKRLYTLNNNYLYACNTYIMISILYFLKSDHLSIANHKNKLLAWHTIYIFMQLLYHLLSHVFT